MATSRSSSVMTSSVSSSVIAPSVDKFVWHYLRRFLHGHVLCEGHIQKSIPYLVLDVDVCGQHVGDGLIYTLSEAVRLWMVGSGSAVSCLAVKSAVKAVPLSVMRTSRAP